MEVDFEGRLIMKAIDQIKKLIEERHDIESALVMMELCKYIVGDGFEVTVEVTHERKGNE